MIKLYKCDECSKNHFFARPCYAIGKDIYDLPDCDKGHIWKESNDYNLTKIATTQYPENEQTPNCAVCEWKVDDETEDIQGYLCSAQALRCCDHSIFMAPLVYNSKECKKLFREKK